MTTEARLGWEPAVRGARLDAEARHRRRRKALGRGVVYLILIGGALITLFPLIWMILATSKTNTEILAFPPTFLPRTLTLDNFVLVLTRVPMGRWFVNSMVVATTVTLSILFTSSLAGYALAHLEFPGRPIVFLGILATLMVPGWVVAIPLFITVRNLGLINSYGGLVLPALVSAYGIFLMRQFTSTIPSELLDAGRIDGSSEFGIYWSIVLPNTRPAIGTLALFSFLTQWDAFFWPLLVVNDQMMKTLPLGLIEFRAGNPYEQELGGAIAGAFLVMLPVLAVFLVAEKQIIKGITLTGLKG